MLRRLFLFASLCNIVLIVGAERFKSSLSSAASATLCSCSRAGVHSCAACCKMMSWGVWGCGVCCLVCVNYFTPEPSTVTRSLNEFSKNMYQYAEGLEKKTKKD